MACRDLSQQMQHSRRYRSGRIRHIRCGESEHREADDGGRYAELHNHISSQPFPLMSSGHKLTEEKHDLEPKVVYELILSHGRTDLYLFYAGLNDDHDKIVEHWVIEEQWLKAIDVLNRQASPRSTLGPLLILAKGLARVILPLCVNTHASCSQGNSRFLAPTSISISSSPHSGSPATTITARTPAIESSDPLPEQRHSSAGVHRHHHL